MPRNFGNWLKAYIDYTEFSESPTAFHFWTGVATIAGALRRKVWIDQRYFQWTPNFYIVFVGPPGIVAKSTSMQTGLGLLERIEGIHMGPQSTTWQALTMALEEARESVPYGDETDPVNMEYRDMSCVTCAVSELGTFLRTQDGELVDVLVDLWDGRLSTWKRRTKTQGDTSINNPWINIIACTTPSWLKENFPEHMIGGGLTSRIIFVYGDQKRHLVPYPADVVEDEAFKAKADLLVDDLQQISDLKGEYKLDKPAKLWGVKWYEKHWTSRPVHMASARYEGYIARKQTHIHKLAIILAAAQRNELVITEDDLKTADRFITDLEADMLQVFESIGIADTAKTVGEIINFLRVHKKLSKRELFHLCYTIMTHKEFVEACEAGVTAGMLRITQEGNEYFYHLGAKATERKATVAK